MCGLIIDNSAASYTFQSGTGTLCATNPTTLSGAFTAPSRNVAVTGSILVTPPGDSFCVIVAGSGSVEGAMSAVQAP